MSTYVLTLHDANRVQSISSAATSCKRGLVRNLKSGCS